MNSEKVKLVEKARKLYNLIQSSNEHESLLAQIKFNEYCIKHKISSEEVEYLFETVVIELDKEVRSELDLFVYILIDSFKDSSILASTVKIVQISDSKINVTIPTYFGKALLFKYERYLKKYIEAREEVIQHLDNRNKRVNHEIEINLIRLSMEALFFGKVFEESKIRPLVEELFADYVVEFDESLFLFTFCHKANLQQRPSDDVVEKEAKPLSDEQIKKLQFLSSIYSVNGLNLEIDFILKLEENYA